MILISWTVVEDHRDLKGGNRQETHECRLSLSSRRDGTRSSKGWIKRSDFSVSTFITLPKPVVLETEILTDLFVVQIGWMVWYRRKWESYVTEDPHQTLEELLTGKTNISHEPLRLNLGDVPRFTETL